MKHYYIVVAAFKKLDEYDISTTNKQEALEEYNNITLDPDKHIYKELFSANPHELRPVTTVLEYKAI